MKIMKIMNKETYRTWQQTGEELAEVRKNITTVKNSAVEDILNKYLEKANNKKYANNGSKISNYLFKVFLDREIKDYIMELKEDLDKEIKDYYNIMRQAMMYTYDYSVSEIYETSEIYIANWHDFYLNCADDIIDLIHEEVLNKIDRYN